jgi:hypothetical protein
MPPFWRILPLLAECCLIRSELPTQYRNVKNPITSRVFLRLKFTFLLISTPPGHNRHSVHLPKPPTGLSPVSVDNQYVVSVASDRHTRCSVCTMANRPLYGFISPLFPRSSLDKTALSEKMSIF